MLGSKNALRKKSVRLPFFIASDHAGFSLKTRLQNSIDLSAWNREWVDLGPATTDSVDYPHYGQKLSRQVLATFSREQLLTPCGVLICGSGVGVSISANRFAGIRAVLAWNEEVAALSRQHNAANLLCMGERLIAPELAEKILTKWLSTEFEGGRHERRVLGIEDISSNPLPPKKG